jgi:tryptophanyl-tRNA synthetase
VWLFESGKKLRAAINRIVTDSQPPEAPKDPDALLLFRFLELFLESAELEEWRARVRRGGPEAPGYGHLKARIAEAIEARFEPARRRREELLARPAEVDAVLAEGARRARARAQRVLERARQACGLR